jgi:hypothetical protein
MRMRIPVHEPRPPFDAPERRGSGRQARKNSEAIEMTQQYLAGELSMILAELQAVATDEASARDVARSGDRSQLAKCRESDSDRQ